MACVSWSAHHIYFVFLRAALVYGVERQPRVTEVILIRDRGPGQRRGNQRPCAAGMAYDARTPARLSVLSNVCGSCHRKVVAWHRASSKRRHEGRGEKGWGRWKGSWKAHSPHRAATYGKLLPPHRPSLGALICDDAAARGDSSFAAAGWVSPAAELPRENTPQHRQGGLASPRGP